MAPRAYRLAKRAEAMTQTRERVVEATCALHAEKGIAATSVKDIAARADVSVGTVYYHFPTYDDVLRACGERMADVTQPPTATIFEGLRGRRRRVTRLAEELFAYYERYPSFERGRCDRDKLPVLAEAIARRERHLESLVREALRPLDDEQAVAMIVALTDFAVYRSLVARGMPAPAAARQVAEASLAWLGRHREAAIAQT